MRIIFLEAVQNFGGARKSTVELASRLSKVHEVMIVDFYGSCKPFVETALDNKIKLSILCQRENPFIINVSTSKIKNLFNALSFFPHWLKLRSRLREVFKNFRPDYVIVNNAKTLSLLSFTRKDQFKVLYFPRGWFTPLSISKLNKLLYRRYVDQFICVSEATRHAVYCGGLAPLDKIFVVHNAINENKLPHKIEDLDCDNDCVKILHSGGFLPDKGQHVSIRVAKILKEKGVKFKLILTGLIYQGAASRKYYEGILKTIKEFDLENEVLIVKDNPNVISYFRACDIVIHPSSTEGLPRVVMEAMCLKKPVIANAVGGVTDYILHGFTGFITQFNNPKDYVFYIETLINDREKYQFIAENAYRLIKASFNEQEQIIQFKKVFEQ